VRRSTLNSAEIFRSGAKASAFGPARERTVSSRGAAQSPPKFIKRIVEMSTTEVTGRVGQVESLRSLVDLRPLWIATGSLCGFYFLLRIYEHVFGASAGLDSYAPEFQTYWMTPLSVAIAVGFVAALAVVGLLWRTRDRALSALEPREEIRRYTVLVQWLFVYAIAIYWALSFFMEQSAAWHMTTIRDTDFTPSNIVTFYIAYPIVAILGAGAFFYAKTRLPRFARGYPLALMVLTIGTFMAIPSVGFSEWGHSAWLMEEGFVQPLHWGFAVFGWMSLAMFGVVLLIVNRLKELVGTDCLEQLRKR
jgi:methane/ammonia monooxygenase subunit C